MYVKMKVIIGFKTQHIIILRISSYFKILLLVAYAGPKYPNVFKLVKGIGMDIWVANSINVDVDSDVDRNINGFKPYNLPAKTSPVLLPINKTPKIVETIIKRRLVKELFLDSEINVPIVLLPKV